MLYVQNRFQKFNEFEVICANFTKKWIFDNKSLITFDNLIIQSAFYFMYYLQHEVNYSYILLNIYILNISIYINEIEFLNK